MQFGVISESQYLIRLEKGEEIITSLVTFCIEKSIKNGSISGIGSLEKPTLAHYKVDTKEYSKKEFEGIFEVTSLLGTIGLSDNTPLVHAHVTLGDEHMSVIAGHLVKGIVSATLELTLTVFPTEFTKVQNEEIGLKLFSLPDNMKL